MKTIKVRDTYNQWPLSGRIFQTCHYIIYTHIYFPVPQNLLFLFFFNSNWMELDIRTDGNYVAVSKTFAWKPLNV